MCNIIDEFSSGNNLAYNYYPTIEIYTRNIKLTISYTI